MTAVSIAGAPTDFVSQVFQPPLLGVVANVVAVPLRSAHRVRVDHRRAAGHAEHQPAEQRAVLVLGADRRACGSVAVEHLLNPLPRVTFDDRLVLAGIDRPL